MYRVSLDNVGAHRSCRPLYEQHQLTPYATFLDPSQGMTVYSGMVMARTGPDTVALLDGASATGEAFGLSALDYNPIINDLDGLNIRPWAVWIGGPDGFLTLEGNAFDTGQAYTVPTNGSRQKLWAGTGAALGKITSNNAGLNSDPVAELIEVVSPSKIIVRLFAPVATT